MRSADPDDERLHDSFIPKCENDGAPSRFGSSFMLFSGHHSLRFGPRWQAARAALADAMAALFFGRERRRSREALKNFATSIGWMAVNWCMAPVIYIAMKSTQQLYGTLSIPALPASTWETVPWPILLLISVLLKDFADYWNHRLMHMRWIWPIHAVHHSDTHVNFLTSYRIHFLESVFMDASYVILLTWLGVPPIIGAIGGRLFTLHNVYVHIDIDFGHGPFKYILASPRLHRWHHADHPDALGKNLAILFPFYDLLFGTYYLPGRCDKPMGALSENVPPFNLAAQVALPFTRWLQMGSASAKHLAGWAFATARPRPKA
jgi:sterol desaturase/sphingolipid hydroxylase (fatty acid hydroxylase superfamily)